MNTRHAERVEGCGSPVETSARSAEAPTEPAGETKSFCPCQNKKTPAGVFLFWLGLNNLNTRHAERVEGCGSPVETSARSAEAPTEPAGETKSFCPCQIRTKVMIPLVLQFSFFFFLQKSLFHKPFRLSGIKDTAERFGDAMASSMVKPSARHRLLMQRSFNKPSSKPLIS